MLSAAHKLRLRKSQKACARHNIIGKESRTLLLYNNKKNRNGDMKKKILIFVWAIMLVNLSPRPVFSNQPLNLNVNGEGIELGKWLIQEEDTSYIPYAVISNLIETQSFFDEDNQSLTIETNNTKLWLQASNKTAVINDTKIGIESPPKMIYNTLFVPLKMTFETLGAQVGWEKETNSITIDGDIISYKGQTLKELLDEPLPEGYTQIKINAAGDCTLGFDDKTSKANRFDTVLNEKGGDYGYFFKNVKHIFEMDDLTIVNLETPLTNATTKAVKQFAFKGRPEYTQILKQGSIEAVNLANNHTYDYLEQGMKDTISHLKSANINYFGNGAKSITDIKGIKVANLGYKGWSNANSVKNGIKNDIAAMRKTADLVIVTFHWGDEGVNYPNNIQKDLGRFAIDQGADLVLGHHPHVIQGIEEYKGKPIVYSLGNFSFGGNRNPSDKDTFIFQQNFIFNENKEIVSAQFNVIPCTVSSVNYRNDYAPTPQVGANGLRILNRIKQYSNVFPTPASL